MINTLKGGLNDGEGKERRLCEKKDLTKSQIS